MEPYRAVDEAEFTRTGNLYCVNRVTVLYVISPSSIERYVSRTNNGDGE